MNYRFCLLLLVAAISWPATGISDEKVEPLEPLAHHGLVAQLVTTYAERLHYGKRKLDKEMSKDVFDQYVNNLDKMRMYFTQEDLDALKDVRGSLHIALKSGDAPRAFKVFEMFRSRLLARAEYAQQLLTQPFDLNPDMQLQARDRNSPWPISEAELDSLWQKRVNRELVDLTMSGLPLEEARNALSLRYAGLAQYATSFIAQDAFDQFLNAYLTVLDPANAYFAPRGDAPLDLENEGVGLGITFNGMYPVATTVLPGGAAEKAGVRSGDQITGVGHLGTDEFVDTLGMLSMEHLVRLLRGKPGTTVYVRVLSAGGAPGRDDRILELTRSAISMEGQSVRGRMTSVKERETEWKVGVLTVPTLYLDFSGKQRGDQNYRSVTRDARKEIERLKSEGMQALLVDVRNNGGGSLIAAANLAALFIGDRLAGQVVSGVGKVEEIEPKHDDIAWEGPLLLLVDHGSASGTELFVSAIQDAGGLVAGTRTYGRATIQNVFDLNKHFRSDINLGQLRLTIGMLHRISGEPFQQVGVTPDIVLESMDDGSGLREADSPHALPPTKADQLETAVRIEPAAVAATLEGRKIFDATVEDTAGKLDVALSDAAKIVAAYAKWLSSTK